MIQTQNIKEFSENREERAKAILQIGNPEYLNENTYLVPSQFDSNKKYHVTHFDSYSCECADFQSRCKENGLYCKHIKAILLFEKLKSAYEVEHTPIKREIETIAETTQKNVCPFCSSNHLIKRGIRKTQLGIKQLFCCKSCKKRFVLEPIKNIKGNAKFVCLAMDCYYKGLSYRDISDQFSQFYNLKISHVTIREWVLRFSEIINKYAKTIQPKIKGDWNADETLILTKRGKNEENTNYDYVWNVIDNKTKFLLASECSGRSRKSKDAKNVMTEAYKQNGQLPDQVITDRYRGYEEGIRKAFRNYGNSRIKVKHVSIVGKRKIINNNAVESHHTQQKEFHKIRRGVTEVQSYQDGFKVFHNFVRKSARQKLTPADKCGIGINGNRWENMLLKSLEKTK